MISNSAKKKYAILVVCLLILVILTIAFYITRNSFILSMEILLLLIMIISPMINDFKNTIISGIRGFHYCEDPLFKEIDEYKKCGYNNNSIYVDNIRIINWYYKENGKVDTDIIEKRDLLRLYERKSFIINQLKSYDDIWSTIVAFSISFVFSSKIIAETKGVLDGIISLLVVISVVLYLVFSKYDRNGMFRSLDSMIYEYELKLLERKIESLANSLQISDDGEKIIRTKKDLIIYLKSQINYVFPNKKTNKLNEDVGRIQNLDLYLKNYDEYVMTNIFIRNKMGAIVHNNTGEQTDYEEKTKTEKDIDFLWHYMNPQEVIGVNTEANETSIRKS